MLVSIEHIRNHLVASGVSLAAAKDVAVSERVRGVAEAATLPVAIVTGVSHSHLCFTGKGAHYIIISTYESSDEEELLSTLHHELIHYDQVRRGDLKSTFPGAVQWKGETYFTMDTPVLKEPKSASDAAMQMLALVKYMAQPWEWEAGKHELERVVGPILAKALLAAHDQLGTVWSDSWNRHTFMAVLTETLSMSKAYEAVTGIMIKQ